MDDVLKVKNGDQGDDEKNNKDDVIVEPEITIKLKVPVDGFGDTITLENPNLYSLNELVKDGKVLTKQKDDGKNYSIEYAISILRAFGGMKPEKIRLISPKDMENVCRKCGEFLKKKLEGI